MGALVAIPAIRLSGLYLALATFGFGILVQQLLYSQTWMFTTVAEGKRMPRPSWAPSLHDFYYVVLAVSLVSLFFLYRLQWTRFGFTLLSLRTTATEALADPRRTTNGALPWSVPTLGRACPAPSVGPPLAAEAGVNLAEIAGTGPSGAVVAADIRPPVRSSPSVPDAGIQVSRTWRSMAERTTQSWREAPHFYLQRECDATRLNSWRDTLRRKPGYEAVSHTDLLVKICAAALREHPRVNGRWENGTVMSSASVNVGIAAATAEGLVVPVVHDAGDQTLTGLARSMRRQIDKAKANLARLVTLCPQGCEEREDLEKAIAAAPGASTN